MPHPRSFTDPNWPKNMTTKDNLRFWLAYEKQRVLWDFYHNEYSCRMSRNRAFQSIVNEMGIERLDLKNVKLKIRFLRTQYTRWIRRLCLLKETGEPFPKIPTWFHIADKFLRDQIRLRKPNNLTETHYLPGRKLSTNASEAEVYFGSDMPVSSTIEVIETMNEEEIDDEQHSERFRVKQEADSSHYADNSIYLELDDEQLMAIENGEISIEDVTARAEAAANQHQQQLAAARLNEQAEEVEEEEDDGTRSRMDDEGSEAEDEFDAFGRCVALKLRTLPLDTALELESQIHTLITRKRMTLLKQNKRH